MLDSSKNKLNYRNYIFIISLGIFVSSCNWGFDKLKTIKDDASIETDTTHNLPIVFVPDSCLNFNFWSEVTGTCDSLLTDTLFTGFSPNYSDDSVSIFCFRGNYHRNAPSRNYISGKPTDINVTWRFTTEYDSTETKFGVWGGGAGWTGQPLLINWDYEQKKNLGISDVEFLNNSQAFELIIGSLCGNIYFLNAATGKPTREHLSIGNPIKGTVSVDPRKNGLLYVGQGIQNTDRFGAYVFDMFSSKEIFHLPGYDKFAFSGWGAFDSNPLIDKQTGTVFWPSENGIIYRFVTDSSKQIKQLAKLRYRHDHIFRHGIESSMAVIGNTGFVADNSGTILCFNLQTMQPVWNIDNFDDTDASLLVDEESSGDYFLYTGNEVDKLAPVHASYFRKIDAKTGNEIWRISRNCHGSDLNGKTNSGGMLSSPALGKHKAAHLVYCLYSRTDSLNRSELIAVNKANGKEVFTVTLDHYSWSSPADFYDDQGNAYLFFTDVQGKIYIIDGLTGELLVNKSTDYCFESSPIIFNDKIYIASRGKSILCFEIKCNIID